MSLLSQQDRDKVIRALEFYLREGFKNGSIKKWLIINGSPVLSIGGDFVTDK